MKTLAYWFLCCLVNISFQSSLFASTQAQSEPEIHLLIDSSGSMKKTDPQKLRIKAVELFNHLIHDKAIMSVSSFSTQLNPILPASPVSNEFIAKFNKQKATFKANGLWTNIDGALEAANTQWTKNSRKIIVLLTDGRLDLGSTELNEAS